MRYYSELPSPIGPITVLSDGIPITGLTMRAAADVTARGGEWIESDDRLAAAREQLAAYFAGELRTFSLKLAPVGTGFQQQVWKALQEIPFGETRSYGALAVSLGYAGSARAIGAANRTNPIGIVVPCHRIIGADGTLTGYAGGIDRKRFLLEHEAAVSGAPRQLEMRI